MPERRLPNVLLISTDQQRFDSLGCYGNPAVQTPVLDQLAAEGTLFENCYAASPMCSPSRASLMTGLYPRNHGLWANGVAMAGNHPLLSRTLADIGYDCGLVGKFHLAPADAGRTEQRFDDGFRMFEWAHDPVHTSPQNRYQQWLAQNHPDIYQAYQEQARRPWDAEAGNQARGALPLDTVRPEAHYSSWVADKSIEFIDDDARPDGQPFFLIANFFDPHHPFGAPQEFLDLYDPATLRSPVGSIEELRGKPSPQLGYSEKSYAGTAPGFQEYSPQEISELIATYYAMISLVDSRVGRILAALDRSGRADDTLVIFTSDHGEMLGDHAMLLKGPMLYEGAVRVPLIVKWKDHLPAGARIPQLVETIDLTSTVLAATGVSAMRDAQGADLRPLANGTAENWRDWSLVEYRDGGFPQAEPIFTTMLRHGRYKLIFWHGRPAVNRPLEGELYDLESDPGEINNRWNDPGVADVRREMTERLVDVMVATEDRSQPRTANW